MFKKSLYLMVIAGVVVVTLGVLFAKPELYKGQLVDAQIGIPKGSGSCGAYHQWAKVFEGSYSISTAAAGDRWYALSVTLAVTHPQLQAFVRDGCDFKLVVDARSGGGSGPQSYECSVVSAYAGPSDVTPLTNTFACNSAVYSPDGRGSDGYSEGKRLVFQGRTIYFQPLGNQPDPSGPLTLSLFVKK